MTTSEYRPGQEWFADLLDAQAAVAANERFLWFSVAQAGMGLATENPELATIIAIFEKDVADYKESFEQFASVLDSMLANAKRNAEAT